MDDQYRRIFSRNIGIFAQDEQSKLRNATVAIAGVGGVGGLLTERLVRLGVGNIKITDPETFEETNLNRQFGSGIGSLGKNKAETVFKQVRDINLGANISYSSSGIVNENDAETFAEGCDVIIDEMDYGLWKESILLQRAARKRGIYYLFTSALGFGALAVIFDPHGMTLEEYNGLPPNVNLDELKGLSVPLEIIMPVTPSYFMKTFSQEMIQQIIEGKRPAPTCSIGVGLTSILAASEAMNILLRRKEIIAAPGYIFIDLLDRTYKTGTMH